MSSRLDKVLFSHVFTRGVVGALVVAGVVMVSVDPSSITGKVATVVTFVAAAIMAAYGVVAIIGFVGFTILAFLKRHSSGDPR